MDLLDTLALELPCVVCHGTYRVPLKNIKLSQQILHEGCPVRDDRENPPLENAPLLNPQTLRRFLADFAELEEEARGWGAKLVFEAGSKSNPEQPPRAA